VFHPVILLPDGIDAHLTPLQLESVLFHEMAQVPRRDNLTGLIAGGARQGDVQDSPGEERAAAHHGLMYSAKRAKPMPRGAGVGAAGISQSPSRLTRKDIGRPIRWKLWAVHLTVPKVTAAEVLHVWG
jgi:hypothetical protein